MYGLKIFLDALAALTARFVSKLAGTTLLAAGKGTSISSGTAAVALTPLIVRPVMGITDSLLITWFATWSNNANNKLITVVIDGVTVHTLTVTTTASGRQQIEWANAGATNSQEWYNSSTSFSVGTTSPLSSTVDTSVVGTIQLFGQPAVGGDAINVRRYRFELIPGL